MTSDVPQTVPSELSASKLAKPVVEKPQRHPIWQQLALGGMSCGVGKYATVSVSSEIQSKPEQDQPVDVSRTGLMIVA